MDRGCAHVMDGRSQEGEGDTEHLLSSTIGIFRVKSGVVGKDRTHTLVGRRGGYDRAVPLM